MKMKSNKDLKNVYDKIFKEGESKVFTPFLTKGKPTAEVEEVLKELKWKNKKVLEVGCGTGSLAFNMAKKGAKVLAIDYSKEAIKEAGATHHHSNLIFKNLDVSKITGKYDVIVSLGTLEHFDNPLKILKLFKKHLLPSGRIIVTCPNWLNPRGYILMTLHFLFDAPITLADLHYLTPGDFLDYAKSLSMDLKWRTFDRDWAHGDVLIKDFKKRLPNVLIKDAKMLKDKKNINRLINWIEKRVIPFDNSLYHSGAIGLYNLRLKK